MLFELSLVPAAVAGSINASGGKEGSAVFWYQTLTGTLVGNGGSGRSTADLSPADSVSTGFGATLKAMGSVAVDLSYTPLSLDTTFTSSAGFGIGGVQFGAVQGGKVAYRMPIVEGDLRWIVMSNDWFRICTSACLKLVFSDVTLSSSGQQYRFVHTIPIPMAGVSGQVNLASWLKLYGSYKFLDMGIASVEANVHDLDVGLIFDWNRETWPSTVRFASGYRRLTLDLATNKDSNDESALAVRHEGPFVEASLSF